MKRTRDGNPRVECHYCGKRRTRLIWLMVLGARGIVEDILVCPKCKKERLEDDNRNDPDPRAGSEGREAEANGEEAADRDRTDAGHRSSVVEAMRRRPR